jgi:F0F1-type ATP synthase membrane subunit b/b'
MQKAEEEAKAEIASLKDKSDSQKEEIKATAEKNLDKAVSFIIERIIE